MEVDLGKITLYTTHCPKCSVLEKKLIEKGIQYEVNDNVKDMLALKIVEAPKLSVLMDFTEALNWIKQN